MSSSLITPDAPGLPALSRTFTAFRERVIGPEPTDQQYLDSFAEQLSDLGGRRRWALAGSALTIWEGEDPPDGLRRRIDELVDEYEGKIYKGQSVRCHATTRHCWMLGTDKAYARPTVVISHSDEDILRKTMRVILKSKTLKSKGFELKGCPNCDLELLTGASEAKLIHYVEELGQGLPIGLCGAEIEVKGSARVATLGGLLILDGMYYGVTVAHAFTESRQPTREKLGGSNDVVFYDSDWAGSSSEEENIESGGAKKRRIGSPTSSVSKIPENKSQMMACTIRSQLMTRHDTEEFPVAVISSNNPLRDTDDNNYDDADWALIEISNPIYHGMNEVALDKGQRSRLVSISFRNFPPRGAILTATRRGTVRGLGTGSTSSIRLFGSSRNRDVWSIQTERALDPGDSGAWVVDAATGDIYGVLVAGSAMMQEGYVIPAFDIIDDIRRSTKACELRMPTMNDVLCLASRYGNVDLVKSLIAAGVVVNERPGFTESSTALLEAVEHEQLEVIEVLLSAGAKLNIKGHEQYGRIAVLADDRFKRTDSLEGRRSDASPPLDSLSVPDRTLTVEAQVRTPGSRDESSKLSKTGDTRLTTTADLNNLNRLLRSRYSLDRWVRTLERHEAIYLAIPSRDMVGGCLSFPPAIMSH